MIDPRIDRDRLRQRSRDSHVILIAGRDHNGEPERYRCFQEVLLRAY